MIFLDLIKPTTLDFIILGFPQLKMSVLNDKAEFFKAPAIYSIKIIPSP
jgi:hypothetical protein